jgi:membrane protease YdiL (CAAX protease family)
MSGVLHSRPPYTPGGAGKRRRCPTFDAQHHREKPRNQTMENDHSPAINWIRRAGLFILFLFFGLLLFVVFSHMRPTLPESIDPVGRIILIAVFLTASILSRRSRRLEKYGQLLFAGFIASLAMAIDYYLPSRDGWLRLLHVSLKTPAGIAIDKLDSSLIIIFTVILLTRISGQSLGSIYLKKGNLKQGLIVGGLAFVAAAAGSIPVSGLFFGGRNLRLDTVLSWAPWIVIFIAGNAFNEELLFRGLFLRKLDPFLGRFCSNLVIAIPFALHHSGVSYTPDALMFLAILLPLALAWGYLMQKTDSLWGSVLFHAGMDIPIVLGIFSTL